MSSDKGSYLLLFQLDQPLTRLQIGKFGVFDFAAGAYLYVGSAFGSGGLPARLAYHQRRQKQRPHWHIDYLRPALRLLEAWTVSCPLRLECNWCGALARLSQLQTPVPGFGARDTGCPSHLFYAPVRPSVHIISRTLLAELPFEAFATGQLRIEVHLYSEEPS